MENWQIKFIERPERMGVEMVIYRRAGTGRTEAITLPTDTTIKTYERGEAIPPGFYLNPELFQALVDVVHKDFKPSEGKYTEGKLEGTERHLKDLRKILKLEDQKND